SPAITEAGGIWFGMSGSPVYHEGRLMGALAFGLSFGPSSVAGLTPAEEMVKLFDLPSSPTLSAESLASSDGPERARISRAMRREIAQETGASEESVGGSFERLKVPLSVSGAGRGLARVRRAVRREGLSLLPHAGSATAASASVLPGASLGAGSSFAAALSYGDITIGGVGTTTMACDGRALAWGHPFSFTGRTSMGANAADALTIVKDPFFGAFKLATIEEGVGIVDQDRLAGLRGVFGVEPESIPLTAAVTALDTGRSRTGQTLALSQEVAPFLAFFHGFANIDSTFDQISGGSSDMSWIIRGTRESGGTWSLSRSNKFADDFDISFGSMFELESQLHQLLNNDFESVGLTSVDFNVAVEETVRRYTVEDLLVSTNGRVYRNVNRVRVSPGATIFLKVVLQPTHRTAERVVNMSLRVPSRARRGGSIEMFGGSGEFDFGGCFFEFEECGAPTSSSVDSFDELLSSLERQPKNNRLTARLRMGRLRSRDTQHLDQVVSGSQFLDVLITR
ncbi:MAG TPA: hypothetical protein VE889_08365, partial [Actinomycetota bacterium]|nr:hypothetical protein [Actinomycetota bacterium]